MKKYFCASDVHSFYTELFVALKAAGYNRKNKKHILIICGDIFDRGYEALKLYKFIQSIPKSRRILIRGNHELLYFNLLNKEYPDSYDFSNGTVDTFCQITQNKFGDSSYFEAGSYTYFDEHVDDSAKQAWNNLRQAVLESPVTKFLQSSEWKDYYELDKYIFVHSFIPTKLKQITFEEFSQKAQQFENLDYFEYNPDWRTATTEDWDYATWGCPWEQYKAGLFAPEESAGKTLVCGHWHTSDFYKNLKNIQGFNSRCAPIYYSKGLIGLDGGVMYSFYGYSHPQNVLVIENSICYDKFGDELIEPTGQAIIETVSKGTV